MSLEDPTTLGDDLVLVALVTPELGVISGSTRTTLTGDPTFVLAVGMCFWRRLFERIEVGKVGGEENSAKGGGAGEEGDELTKVESQALESAILAVIGDDMVEKGHFEGSFRLVVREGGIKEGAFVAMRIVSASAAAAQYLDTRRTGRLDWATIKVVRCILKGSVICSGAADVSRLDVSVALRIGLSTSVLFIKWIGGIGL